MEFNEYQQLATKTMEYPNAGHNLVYTSLGLVGEAGEVAEKVKKLWRNKNVIDGHQASLDDIKAIAMELGDVLWYIAACCEELNISMDIVALANLDKLEDRKTRGVIKSQGDNR